MSLAVAAIPEGLPAITTITLALGMQRMAKRGAIVRKLAAVETLGAATVICTDKTGTLTQNEMTVREVYAGGARYHVTGTGYDPHGRDPRHHRAGASTSRRRGRCSDLLATVALCNNATLADDRTARWRVLGDPTEGALLTLAGQGRRVARVDRALAPGRQGAALRQRPQADDDRHARRDGARDRAHEGQRRRPPAALRRLRDATTARAPLDDEARRAILAEAERMSSAGAARARASRGASSGRTRRELARAAASRRRAPSAEIENRLTFLGLVGMIDPPREGVKEAVALCAEAHVRAVMITGDHKLTAVAIAKELGLWDEGALALTGAELEKLDRTTQLAARIEHVRVFARVTAEQKLRIVRAFKARGHVVAMTGDGVNDAPALREAHIGVAMGKDGTDVAREAADMVLADDNFATIVDAVREGRAIWRNIQKFIFFLLSSNAGLLVAVFAVSFFTDLPAADAADDPLDQPRDERPARARARRRPARPDADARAAAQAHRRACSARATSSGSPSWAS